MSRKDLSLIGRLAIVMFPAVVLFTMGVWPQPVERSAANGGAGFPDGSPTAPSITFSEERDMGFFRKSPGSIALALRGFEFARWHTQLNEPAGMRPEMTLTRTAGVADNQAPLLNLMNTSDGEVMIRMANGSTYIDPADTARNAWGIHIPPEAGQANRHLWIAKDQVDNFFGIATGTLGNRVNYFVALGRGWSNDEVPHGGVYIRPTLFAPSDRPVDLNYTVVEPRAELTDAVDGSSVHGLLITQPKRVNRTGDARINNIRGLEIEDQSALYDPAQQPLTGSATGERYAVFIHDQGAGSSGAIRLGRGAQNAISWPTVTLAEAAEKTLAVAGGDLAVTGPGSGVVLKATDGPNYFRVTVRNDGTLVTTRVAGP